MSASASELEGSSSTPRPRRKKSVRLGLAASLPLLPVALALAVYPVPESNDILVLNGEWRTRVIEPASKLKEVPPVFTVPGEFARGQRASVVVIERRFTLPQDLEGTDLFLMVPNIRSAFARVFINDVLLGEKGILDSDSSLDVGRLDGYTVPHAAMRPSSAGDNILRLDMRYPTPGNALPDGRFLLGKTGVVKTYLERNVSVKHLLEHGALLVSLLGAGLLAYLLSLRPLQEDRALYRAALGVMISTALYLAGKTGVVVGFFFSSADVNAFITYAIIGIAASTPELVETYYVKRVTKFRIVNRAVCALAVVASLVLDIGVVYPTWSVWLFVVIVHAIIFAVRDLVRPSTAYGPVLASAIAVTAVTAAVDLLSDLNIAWTPRLFSFGVANLGVIAAAIVLGDFLRLSRKAQALSSSLAERNAALTTALAAAEESARLKGEFLANTSHELRTPLNAIINIPQALLDRMPMRAVVACNACGAVFETEDEAPPDAESVGGEPCPQCNATALAVVNRRATPADGDELATRLNAVVTSGKHLLGVVNDILDVSKLAALESKGERFALDLSDVPIGDIVRAAVDTVEPLAEQGGVRVNLAPIDPSLIVHADRTRLAQVLINLLSNALKFSPRNSAVHVTVERAGTNVVVKVRDEGEGIAPEHHALIFEAFRQVDGTHTRKHGGTGLGLAIAKQLVTLHDGSISVQSARNEGATFIVALPCSIKG